MRWFWEWGFFVGSTVAALAQGVALGALVQGIEVEDRSYAGGWWDWLTPFSMLTGLALVVGYTLLGAKWLAMKTEGAIRDRVQRVAWGAAVGTLALIGVVSLWTPFLNPIYLDRWFGWPSVLLSLIMPALLAGCAFALFRGLEKGRDVQPFLASLALFGLCFAGIGVSFYPYMAPPSLTIAEAAAPDESLRFLLVGAAALIPLILAYTGYSYWVFRGKVRPGDGYH
jgi:cytochrome d ubiquinol oxidase subunit II